MLKLLDYAFPNPSEERIESARLIALYSLLPELMNLPIEQIVRSLNPNDEIKDALLVHSGLLGRIYIAVLKLENNEVSTAALLLKSYGVSQELLETYL